MTTPAAGGGSVSTKIALAAAAGWPSGRVSNNTPDQAIDGATNTFTWTTESFTQASPGIWESDLRRRRPSAGFGCIKIMTRAGPVRWRRT